MTAILRVKGNCRMKTSFLLKLLWCTVLSMMSASALHAQTTPDDGASLAICSFNIQFLGQSTTRDYAALALILRDCDIVIVQELVAPPFAGTFPDGTAYRPDAEAAAFCQARAALGFSFIL